MPVWLGALLKPLVTLLARELVDYLREAVGDVKFKQKLKKKAKEFEKAKSLKERARHARDLLRITRK